VLFRSGVLTTVYNPALTSLHARTPFDRAYMQQRLDEAPYRRILDERYPDSAPAFDA
jgi:hypothetical protein